MVSSGCVASFVMGKNGIVDGIPPLRVYVHCAVYSGRVKLYLSHHAEPSNSDLTQLRRHLRQYLMCLRHIVSDPAPST